MTLLRAIRNSMTTRGSRHLTFAAVLALGRTLHLTELGTP